MRIDGDLFALMVAQNFPELPCAASQKVTIAFAFSDNVVYVAVDEGVIIFGELLLRFVEGQPFEHADIPFSKSGGALTETLINSASGSAVCIARKRSLA